MKISNSALEGITKALLGLTAAGFLAGLLSACAAPPEATTTQATPTPVATVQQSEEATKRKDWGDQMLRKPAPKKGCFDAAYPSTEWKEVPCVKAPNIPAIPRHGPRATVGGNFNDIAAQAPSGHITQAIGHFENVTNVTSEQGPIANAGPSIADTYTLQINSDFFAGSTACAGSPNPNCKGWEQWIYWNTPGGGSAPGSASMQYWLVSYNANCPAGQGWNQVPVLGTSCYKNSANAVSVPFQAITNMGNWRLTGTATSTGDSISMFDGTMAHTTSGDNAVAASTAWTMAEFNIFGYGGDTSGGGGTASFNANASTDTRTEIIYGGTMPPNCVAQGFTAEMNNLSFGPTPPAATAPGPAVIFQESIAGGAMSNCAAATTVGDTHLHTMNGLFYDFQATGDFLLLQSDPNFTVQTRQVSGAPTWPNAAVNSAVATQMGNDKVAVCLAPSRVNVNGTNRDIPDGSSVSTPDGVDITRKGNIYFISDQGGDSVRATVNSSPDYIDVSVGVGHWPAKLSGLLANPNGNVNQIARRDGSILTAPFSYEALYPGFADSWRVSPRESLLSACSDKEIEHAVPKTLFFANDLDPQLAARTRAVCLAAGVTDPALLEACTLDVAVIGNDNAAKVFVGARPPTAVGNLAPTGGSKSSVFVKWWWLWLLLLVLLVIVVILWILLRKKKKTP